MVWLAFVIALITLITAVEFIFNKPNKDGRSDTFND